MDYTALTDDDLFALIDDAQAELNRRNSLRNAENTIAEANIAYLAATGVVSGAAWRQPQGAHDAYPLNWLVTHSSKTWKSLTSGNVWEPGVSGWIEVVEEGEVPEWIQPTGAHDAYQVGNRVLYEGEIYESLSNGNVWAPDMNPASWAKISETQGPDPTYPEWVQPTGSENAYSTGDRVTFEGVVHESLIDGNTWSPTAYPAGWTLVV